MEAFKLNLKKSEEEAILRALRAGASPHMIAQRWKIPYESAVTLAESVAAEIKSGGMAHRVLLRALLREQASSAVRTLREIADGRTSDADGNPVPVLDTKEKRSVAFLRLRAADTILKHAQRFIDEDIVRGFVEKPEDSRVQETIFDYRTRIDPDGSVVLEAAPRLRVVDPGDSLPTSALPSMDEIEGEDEE